MNPKVYWRKVKSAMKHSMIGRFELWLIKKTKKKEKDENKENRI